MPSLRDILVVSDMDGTLLGPDKELLSCNLETIRLFTKLGGRFTVATGRIAQSVEKYPELVQYLSPGITCNGCVIHDFTTDTQLHSETLPRAVGKEVARDIMAKYPGIGVILFASGDMPYVVNASRQSQTLFDDERIPQLSQPMEEVPDDWNKIIFAGPLELLQEIQEYALSRHYPGVNFVLSSDIYLEVLPQDINKGSALRKLCAMMHINPENTIAIGDYFNDLSMYSTAGRAVAMQDAPVEVRMAANEITGSNRFGGVGQFLYGLIREYT